MNLIFRMKLEHDFNVKIKHIGNDMHEIEINYAELLCQAGIRVSELIDIIPKRSVIISGYEGYYGTSNTSPMIFTNKRAAEVALCIISDYIIDRIADNE